METVIAYLNENSATIFIWFTILASVICYIRSNGSEKILYKAALYLVSLAEEEWGSGTGKIKFAEVYIQLKKEYPLLTLFVSEKTLTDLIENALTEMKKILKEKQEKEEAAKLEETKVE